MLITLKTNKKRNQWICCMLLICLVISCKVEKKWTWGGKKEIVKGIDVSKYQGNIRWSELVKENNLQFTIARATEGRTVIDTTFTYNWREIHKMKLVGGAYHFYLNEDLPLLQAKLYLETVSFTKGDLPPILDVEGYSIQKKKDSLIENCLIWLQEVEKKTGRTPIIYSNLDFFIENLNDSTFAKYPIWIAEYTTSNQPRVPKPWSTWLFWQKSDSYKMQGINANVDFDIFNGDMSKLEELSQD